MIHFAQQTTPQTVLIPRSSLVPSGNTLTLSLYSTVNRREMWSHEVQDAGSLRDYFTLRAIILHSGDFNEDFNEDFLIGIPLPAGEYEYTLAGAGMVYAQGLAIIGDYAPGGVRQHHTDITYVQYDGNN